MQCIGYNNLNYLLCPLVASFTQAVGVTSGGVGKKKEAATFC